MSSYYKYLPSKSVRRSRSTWNTQQLRRYIFALLLLLTVMLMSLYEFYATVVERAKQGENQTNIMEAILCQVFMLTSCPKRVKDTEEKDLSPPRSSPSILGSSFIQDLKRKIDDINKFQFARQFTNIEITNSTNLIVVQVHDRTGYLEELINSMSSVSDINSAILIFSHDYYNEEINKLIQSIQYAPVIQIFYPYSIQLYPDEFPGTSHNDCLWNLDVEKARELECEGANTPDTYGHFRQGEITQAKHHWWWKVNTIFDQLSLTKDFSGYVVFLEEDHYVAPDILHTLQLMRELALVECPECNNLILGNFQSSRHFEEDINKVHVGQWNNLGYSFNRSFWLALHGCSSVFCTFDDYNWDWSYQYAAQECFDQKLKNLVVQSTRVFHVGNCGGMHHKKQGCDFYESLQEAKTQVDSMEPYMFPPELVLDSTNYSPQRIKHSWGGWSDPRDIQLCLNISNSNPAIS